MTTIVYESPVELATNGDCSAVYIRFPKNPELLGMVTELRQNLANVGFSVRKPWLKDDEYMIYLVTPESVGIPANLYVSKKMIGND